MLFIATHHIALDLPHTQQFYREVLTVYDAFVAGQSSPLAELTVQYADYARWRRQKNGGARTSTRHREYWRRQMSGAKPIELPLSRLPPAERTADMHRVLLPLKASIFDDIEGLARLEAVSHFGDCRGHFCRHSLGQISRSGDDVSVILACSTASQLETPELASLIGPFIDFLVIRSGRQTGLTFRDLVRRLSETMRAAHLHSPVSAAIVLEEPGVFDQPYARAIVNLVEEWRALNDEDHLRAKLVADRATPRVTELTWAIVMPVRQSALIVSSDTFDLDAAQRLADGLASLMTRAIAEPDTPISALPIGSLGNARTSV